MVILLWLVLRGTWEAWSHCQLPLLDQLLHMLPLEWSRLHFSVHGGLEYNMYPLNTHTVCTYIQHARAAINTAIRYPPHTAASCLPDTSNPHYQKYLLLIVLQKGWKYLVLLPQLVSLLSFSDFLFSTGVCVCISVICRLCNNGSLNSIRQSWQIIHSDVTNNIEDVCSVIIFFI